MQRIKLIIEYDGTAYHGLQVQPNGHTIQAEMEQCIYRLTGEQINMSFAGRTDAGVHALGQVGVFDSNSTIPPERWQYALNSVLPQDIRVVSSETARPGFHPRFEASEKMYRYRIYRQRQGSTFYRSHAWCLTEPLEVGMMSEAARELEGYHDFRSFCASGSPVKQFDRTVTSCLLSEKGPFLDLEIKADGFLYNMVRIIMGTLVETGRGNVLPHDIARILQAQDRRAAGPTAPPHGLYLVEVYYPQVDPE